MKIDENYYIEMPNELPQKEELSNYALLIYILLRQSKTMYGYGISSIRQLGEMLSYKRIDKHAKNIESALEELSTWGYIDVFNLKQEPIEVEELSYNTSFYVTYEEQESHYFKVYINDIKKIIYTYDNYAIRDLSAFIRYYCVIQRWTNFEDDVAGHHVSNKVVSHIIADNRTIQKYNDALEKMHIFWHENGYRSSKDNRVISTRFARCRKISRNDFQEAVQRWAYQNGYVAYDKLASNEKKSITQQKNWEKKKQRTSQRLECERRREQEQKVLGQFIYISDQYIERLLWQWKCSGSITVEGVKRLIQQYKIILTGDLDIDLSSVLKDKVTDNVIGF